MPSDWELVHRRNGSNAMNPYGAGPYGNSDGGGVVTYQPPGGRQLPVEFTATNKNASFSFKGPAGSPTTFFALQIGAAVATRK